MSATNQPEKVFPVHNYLALGDSYTIGEMVNEDQRFPEQTAALLQAQGIALAPPRIIARTGWTTDELADAIRAAQITDTFSLVTLLIGVNNQYRGRTVENYAPEFEALLEQAIAFAGGRQDHVVVLSIPDWGVTPFGAGRNPEKITAEINAYNAANRRITATLGAHYTDITPGSRKAATDASLLVADGLHPSGKEYRLWAAALAALAAPWLRR
ncbi:Lysophospholipase L1 [Chitinophaga costaii]|uniref:Lysophospholipase L1 n=1 Tax=Chitinophaga costaii TaxID=1335309 RepID=A0A1C4DAU6_9BACT|nr:SGNH/GDSL hydrolase family protein [Chitinophaga costaii]PUZ24541.1 SGNH/GDSL hydrolase family protein [Chitinophaga costaii]SCC28514.1 Lysophospholipase L1 [Chitinophaga costaii]